MRGTSLLALLALLSLALAGCGDKAGAKDDRFGEDLFDDTPEAALGKGLIRGVVVNPALAPVAGATISLTGLQRSELSDQNGAFLFLDLEPGTYFVNVAKPGWTTIQQSVEVAADVDEPLVVKVVLELIPGLQPRAVTLELEGFISCSIGLPVTFLDCNTTDPQYSDVFFDIEGTPNAIQTEILWDSTQPTGDWLYVIQGLCECGGEIPDLDGARFDETDSATSPYVRMADQAFLTEWNVGSNDAKQLSVSVSASGPEPETTNGSGVAVNQDFQVYATFFYNLEPDPEWTFHEDGPYPVPQ